MHSKRSLIRAINRVLYAGGFVFLITGLLLSFLSTSVLAAGAPSRDLAPAPTQITPPNCFCATSTPTLRSTPTVGTPKPTHEPMAVNLSNICGYTFDTFSLWKVANHGSSDVTFTWRVLNKDESGSGTVRGNSDTYFTTTPGVTVRLFVDNQVVDTESCLAPCKKEMELAYSCTPAGLTWTATNVNSFGVDYTVSVDHQKAGSGTIPANSTVKVATSTSGAHTVELTWTDTRPGTHTVTLASPENSCTVAETATPTFTSVAPTLTNTPPPTFTNTPPPAATATATFTPPPVVLPSNTPSPTATSTSTAPTATATNTFAPAASATPTLTPQPGFIPSATPTRTATAIVTLAPPSGAVTSTPVLIPVTGVDLTRPIAANSLSLFGGLSTNIGLFTLGLALTLTAVSRRWKD